MGRFWRWPSGSILRRGFASLKAKFRRPCEFKGHSFPGPILNLRGTTYTCSHTHTHTRYTRKCADSRGRRCTPSGIICNSMNVLFQYLEYGRARDMVPNEERSFPLLYPLCLMPYVLFLIPYFFSLIPYPLSLIPYPLSLVSLQILSFSFTTNNRQAIFANSASSCRKSSIFEMHTRYDFVLARTRSLSPAILYTPGCSPLHTLV